MCIPPVDEEPALHFALLAKMAARNGLAKISMGMSADYETAVGWAPPMSASAPPCSATRGPRHASRACRSCPKSKPSGAAWLPKLVGRRIVRVVQRRPRPAGPAAGAGSPQRVEGRRVLGIDRRAKYLLLRLDDGNTLIAHLGMSGRMTLHDAKSAAEHPFERHDHVVLDTDEGWQVRFNDARRFGLMLLAADDSVPGHKLFKGLGPEPLDEAFDGARPREPSQGTAHAHQGGAARPEDAGRCRQHLCLRGAVPGRHLAASARPIRCRASGPNAWSRPSSRCCCAPSTTAARRLRDHVQPGGELGYFQTRFNVYDRAGVPCPTRGCGKLGASAGAVRPLDLLLRALPAIAKSGAHAR